MAEQVVFGRWSYRKAIYYIGPGENNGFGDDQTRRERDSDQRNDGGIFARFHILLEI